MGKVDWGQVATGGLLGGINAGTDYLKSEALREGEAKRKKALLQFKDQMLADRENAARAFTTSEREAKQTYDSGLIGTTTSDADGNVYGITKGGEGRKIDGIKGGAKTAMTPEKLAKIRSDAAKAYTRKGDIGGETMDKFGYTDSLAGIDPAITVESIARDPELTKDHKKQLIAKHFPSQFKAIMEGGGATAEPEDTTETPPAGEDPSPAPEKKTTGAGAGLLPKGAGKSNPPQASTEGYTDAELEMAAEVLDGTDGDITGNDTITLPNGKSIPLSAVRQFMFSNPDRASAKSSPKTR